MWNGIGTKRVNLYVYYLYTRVYNVRCFYFIRFITYKNNSVHRVSPIFYSVFFRCMISYAERLLQCTINNTIALCKSYRGPCYHCIANNRYKSSLEFTKWVVDTIYLHHIMLPDVNNIMHFPSRSKTVHLCDRSFFPPPRNPRENIALNEFYELPYYFTVIIDRCVWKK